MRTLVITLLALLLVLTGTMAFAGNSCGTCPSMNQIKPPCPSGVVPTQTMVVPSCPTAVVPSCPTPCPPVVQTSCLPACPILSPSIPAALGAGPAVMLKDLCGDEFDRAYVTHMYQLNTDIAALATQGIGTSTDKGIRDLSGKIRTEQTNQNIKHASWAQGAGMGTIPVDYNHVQGVTTALSSQTMMPFNDAYANTMIGLLSQQREAAQLALEKSPCPEIRNQAGIVVRATTKEIDAFQRWLSERQCIPVQ